MSHQPSKSNEALVQDGSAVYEATVPQKKKALELAYALYESGKKRERTKEDDGSFFNLRRELLETIYEIQRVSLQAKDAETKKAVEEGYKLATKHLRDLIELHNAFTTLPEAIEWLEDNSRLYDIVGMELTPNINNKQETK